MSLDQLLIHLQSEGQLHSQGAVTLDPSRAQALLAAHQLTDARHFVFHLLALALLQKANRVQLDCDEHKVLLAYQVLSTDHGLTNEDLQRCLGSFAFKLNNATDLKLRHLASAIAGSSRWGASQFQIHAKSDGTTQITVQRQKVWNLSSLFQSAHPESGLVALVSNAIVAPPDTSIRVNKKHMPQLIQSPWILNILLNGDRLQSKGTVLNLQYPCALPGWESYGAIRFPARLVATRPIKVVVLGRSFDIPASGVLAWADILVHCDHFDADVTLETLAENAIETLRTQLTTKLREALWGLRLEWKNLSPTQQDKLRDLLLDLWSLWLDQSQDPEMDSCQTALSQIPLFHLIGQPELVSLSDFYSLRPDEMTPLYFTKIRHSQPDLGGRCTLWMEDTRVETILRAKLRNQIKDNSWALHHIEKTKENRESFIKDPSSHCWAFAELTPELHGVCGQLGFVRLQSPLSLLYHYLEKSPSPTPSGGIVGWFTPRQPNDPSLPHQQSTRQIWFHIRTTQDPTKYLSSKAIISLLLATPADWTEKVPQEVRHELCWLLTHAPLQFQARPETDGVKLGWQLTQSSLDTSPISLPPSLTSHHNSNIGPDHTQNSHNPSTDTHDPPTVSTEPTPNSDNSAHASHPPTVASEPTPNSYNSATTDLELRRIANLAVFPLADGSGSLSLAQLKAQECQLGYLPVAGPPIPTANERLSAIIADPPGAKFSQLFPFLEQAIFHYGKHRTLIWRPLPWILLQPRCASLYSVVQVLDSRIEQAIHFGPDHHPVHLSLTVDPIAQPQLWVDAQIYPNACSLPLGLLLGIDSPLSDKEQEVPRIVTAIKCLLPTLLKRLFHSVQLGHNPEWVLQTHLFQILAFLEWSPQNIPDALRQICWTGPTGHKVRLWDFRDSLPHGDHFIDPRALSAYQIWALGQHPQSPSD